MARLSRLSKLMIGAGLMAATTAAMADPFMIIATLTVDYLGFTGLQALAVYTSAALLSSSAAKRKQARAAAAARAQYNASLQDRNVTILSAESPWQIVYGSPAPVGGSIAAILSSGDRDEYKHLVIAFAAHECQAIDEVYIDGIPVGTLDGDGWCTAGEFFEGPTKTNTEYLTFDGSGNATASKLVTRIIQAIDWVGENPSGYESTVYYPVCNGTTAITGGPVSTTLYVSYEYMDAAARVNIQKHLSPSGVDTADAFLIARAPDKWTAQDKLSGYTYIVLTLDQNMARFQGGPPNVSAKLQGKKLYDPRTTLTAYSNNPALCVGDFLMSEYGFGATLAQLDESAWQAAANAADTAGFTCDGAFKTDQDRESTKQQLEDSFAATCHESGGVWRINAGSWSASVMTLTDADLAAPIQIEQASYPAKDRFNTVRGKFIDSTGLGVAGDFVPYVNSSYVTADGISRIADVSFPFTGVQQRAQDLAKRIVERSRGGLMITYPGHMRLWPLQPGDRVAVTNSEFGWTAKTFRVTDWSFHPRAPVTLQLIEDVSAFYDAAATVTVDAAPNTNLPDPWTVDAVVNLQAFSGTDQLKIQTDGTIQANVLVTWNASASNYVSTGGRVQVQWREATTVGDTWQDTEPLTGDKTRTVIGNVPDGFYLLIHARFVNSLGVPGEWTTIQHQVVGKTEAPPTVTSFLVDADGLATWSAVTALDLAGYLLRWQPGANTSWGDATPLHEGILTASPYSIAIRPSGTATYMIKAVDTSGNVSAAVASSVVSLGDPIVANVVTSYDYKAASFPGTITNATISGSNLVADADASPLAWNTDANTAGWTLDTDDGWTATTYKDLTYLPTVYEVAAADAGAQLTLQNTVTATAYVIEYRIDGAAAGWTSDSEPGWTSDSTLAWTTEAWRPWPGTVTAQAVRYEWRISTQSAAVQSSISQLTAQLDVVDQIENCGTVSILAAGTVIPTTKTWRSVTGIGLTLVADGGTARTVRVETLSSRTVTTRDSTNTAVDGTVLATLQGY